MLIETNVIPHQNCCFTYLLALTIGGMGLDREVQERTVAVTSWMT